MYAMIESKEAEVDVACRTRREADVSEPYREPLTELGILAYQAAWDADFRSEADLLARALAPLAPKFEHVGTTAIPATAARPIIDVAVGVADPLAVRSMRETLRGCGYRAVEQPDGGFAQHLFVRWQRGLPTHHVHVVEYLGRAWRQMLLFRDVLRIDARLAREYEWLRRRFAALQPANRLAYGRAKATFITSIVGQAT